jgi:hypothetical protein
MLKNGTSPCHDCYATTSRQGGPILKVCGDGLSIVAINLFVGRQNSFSFEIKLVFIKVFFFFFNKINAWPSPKTNHPKNAFASIYAFF